MSRQTITTKFTILSVVRISAAIMYLRCVYCFEVNYSVATLSVSNSSHTSEDSQNQFLTRLTLVLRSDLRSSNGILTFRVSINVCDLPCKHDPIKASTTIAPCVNLNI
jgi:hypothetical protein